MPRVKPYGSKDMQAVAMAKRTTAKLPEKEEYLIRRMNALKELTGKASDKEFAELLGLSDGRYRYLKRHPAQIKLSEITMVQALARQYNFEIGFEMEAAAT